MTDSSDDLEALFDEVSTQRSESPQTTTEELTDSNANNVAKINLHKETEEELPIYNRLGNIVRTLHDSMRELGYDRSLSEVASQINDAQGRLEYVASLTEQAANKVLNATDAGLPEQDNLAKSAKGLEGRWNELFSGQMSLENFKILAADSKSFTQQVQTATDAEKARLLDIMMAQDFQDLTGQLIKKVLIITQSVERELAQILIDNAPSELKEKAIELMEGPSVPKAALEQDDVDNLLDSLGF